MTSQSMELDWRKQNLSTESNKKKPLFTDISRIMSKVKKHILIALKIFKMFSFLSLSISYPWITTESLKSLSTVTLNPYLFFFKPLFFLFSLKLTKPFAVILNLCIFLSTCPKLMMLFLGVPLFVTLKPHHKNLRKQMTQRDIIL